MGKKKEKERIRKEHFANNQFVLNFSIHSIFMKQENLTILKSCLFIVCFDGDCIPQSEQAEVLAEVSSLFIRHASLGNNPFRTYVTMPFKKAPPK